MFVSDNAFCVLEKPTFDSVNANTANCFQLVCVLCVAVQTWMCVGEMEREDAQICTFMKLMLSDLWKNVCTELRSFSASWRFSLSCRTCWEFFLIYMVKVLSSVCTVSAWFASSSACILWYWALTRSFSSDTASCGEVGEKLNKMSTLFYNKENNSACENSFIMSLVALEELVMSKKNYSRVITLDFIKFDYSSLTSPPKVQY